MNISVKGLAVIVLVLSVGAVNLKAADLSAMKAADVSQAAMPAIPAPAPVAAIDTGTQLLFQALENRDADLLALVLKDPRIDVNKAVLRPSGKVQTPLAQVMSLPDNGAMLKLLLTRGDLKINLPDEIGRTPLMNAAWDYPGYYGLKFAFDLLLTRSDIQVNAANFNGWTVLMYAMYQPEAFKVLLDRGEIQVNAVENRGNTCLMMLASGLGGMAQMENLQLLLARNDIQVNLSNHEGKTALELSVEKGNSYISAMLLKHGAQY